jgi:ABC-type nitrate/sulfonate/bicarbonate transport system substrate-binding protein
MDFKIYIQWACVDKKIGFFFARQFYLLEWALRSGNFDVSNFFIVDLPHPYLIGFLSGVFG